MTLRLSRLNVIADLRRSFHAQTPIVPGPANDVGLYIHQIPPLADPKPPIPHTRHQGPDIVLLYG